MAKGPSGGQKAFVAQILAGSRQAQRAQSTIAQRHDANYQAAQPRNLQLERQAAANWGRQSAGAAAYNKVSGGGSILGTIGSGLGDVLKGLDTARATVVSGYQEGLHGIRTATNAVGLTSPVYVPPSAQVQAANYAASVAQDAANNPHDTPLTQPQIQQLRDTFLATQGPKIEQQRAVAQYANAAPSLDRFGANIGKHVGYGQVISAATGHVDPRTGEGTGQITGNSAADFGVGFAGDVALDPLTYVLPSHLGTSEATGAAIDTTNAARAAGDVQGVMRGEEIVAKLGRTKSVAGLTADDLSFIGKDGEGGFRVAGKRIGEQGGQDLRNAIYEHNPLSAARRAAGDVLDRGGLLGRGSVNGAAAEFKAAIRSGVPEDAWAATNALRGERAKSMLLGSVSNQLREQGTAAIKDSGLKPDQLLDAFHGMQGDAEAAARVGGDKLKPLQDWYEEAAKQYEAATGKPLNRLDDYVNRGITDEMKARVGTNQKGSLGSVVADFAKERKIGPGSELFGGVVPEGLSPSGVVKWANTQAETVFGHGMYKTDLAGLMDSYAHQVGTAVGVARRNTLLANAGLLTPRATTEIAPDAARVAAQGEKVAAQEGRVATAADAVTGAKDQTAQAEQALAAHESGSASINALTGKVDLSQLDQAHSAIDYHQQHMDAMVPATAENAPQVGQRVAADAEASQARVVGLAQKGGLTPAKANDYVDASVSFADAKSWGERAASEPDPLKAHLAAMRAQESSLEGAMHEEGIKLSTARDKLSAASVPKQKLAELTQGALRVSFNGIDHEMDPTVARLIQSTMDLTKPKEVGAFLQNYDKILHWVKTWEITSPRFLSHITLGHAWNNALARIEMGSYRDFFAADRAFSKSPEAFDAFRSQSPDVAKAYEDVRQMVDGGAHDYSKVEMGQSGKGTILPTQNNYLVNATRKGGGNIQRMMRTSLGMDTILRKGGTVDDAIEKIAMYHFDYADLSGFERDVVKRVIPFYTWTRRNLPLQLEMLAKRPSVYSKYNAFTRNVEAVSPADKGAGLLPSYFGEQGAFRTPFQEGGSSVYGSAGATPLKEVQDNPLDWRTWASQVAPQLKAPVELYAGKQFYKNLPISDKQMALPSAVKPLAPILTGLGVAQTDKSGNVTVSGKVAYALEQFAPQIAVAQRAPGGAKSKDKAVTNMVNYVLGLGLLVNTPAAQKSEQYRRQNAVQAAKDKAAGKTASFTFKYKPKAK